MTRRPPILLLAALAWGQLSKALVPADPTITAPALSLRQNKDKFIGWVEKNGTWYSRQCDPGLTWYQDGKYAQCCPASLASCYAPTACVDGSLIYPYSAQSRTSTIPCTENFDNPSFSICNTALIFENFGDSNPKTDIVCGKSSMNWSYYRRIPTSSTEQLASKSGSSIFEPVSMPTFATNPTIMPVPKEEKKESMTWIAGAVVGPVVGLALIGAIVFFFFLRRHKKKITSPPTAGAAVSPGDQPPVQRYSDAKPAFVDQGPYPYQQSPGFPDSYNQYDQQPTSPSPQYAAPYSAPGSPPLQGAYTPGHKQAYPHLDSHPQAAELVGVSSPPSSPPIVGASHTAELSDIH